MREAIEYSEETLQDLNDFFENAPVGLHMVGPDGIVIRANKADLDLLGYLETPGAYVGHHIAEFHADRDVIEDMLGRLVAGRPLVNHEARLRRSDGAIVPVLIHSSSRMGDGRFVNTRCFTRRRVGPPAIPVFQSGDERVQGSERARRSLFADLADFFTNASVGLHIVGPDGVIKHANRAELEFLGYLDHPDEYLGHHIADFHADQGVIEDMLQRLLNGRALVNYAARLRRRDGSVAPVLIYSSPRQEEGRFRNTRCFTFSNPAAPQRSAARFAWPSAAE